MSVVRVTFLLLVMGALSACEMGVVTPTSPEISLEQQDSGAGVVTSTLSASHSAVSSDDDSSDDDSSDDDSSDDDGRPSPVGMGCLAGVVSTGDGTPLNGAMVSVVGFGSTASVPPEGAYCLEGLPVGQPVTLSVVGTLHGGSACTGTSGLVTPINGTCATGCPIAVSVTCQ